MDKPRRPHGRRKGSHACDPCRRGRRKCNRSARTQNAKSVGDPITDFSELDVPCWRCIKSGTECTYGEYRQAKCHPKAYVERLEKRVNDLGRLLQCLSLSPDLRREVDTLLDPSSWEINCISTSRFNADNLEEDKFPTNGQASPRHLKTKRLVNSSAEKSHQNTRYTSDLILRNISGDIDVQPQVETLPSNERPEDESSAPSLICTLLPLKGTPVIKDNVPYSPRVSFPNGSVPEIYQRASVNASGSPIKAPLLLFPPKDLLMILGDLYFTHSNIIWPLLHENSFKADVANERYLGCRDFGYVVLGVCAVASRYCKDRRVLAKVPNRSYRTASQESSDSWDLCFPWIDDLEETCSLEDSNYEDAPWCSAGWKYYSRIQQYHGSVMVPVKLTELQTVFLMQQFLFGVPDFTAGWVAVGAAIRRAQDGGVHRAEMYGKPDLKTELWKRAFWCLVVVDRLTSSRHGRSPCLKPDDMNIDLPIEIDDEYWSGPDENGIFVPLQQPPGKPSTVTAFNSLINLSCLYSWSQSTLYLLDKHKDSLKVPGNKIAQEIVDRLNQDLAEWLKSMPLHLKRDSLWQNDVWRTQSANLYITYYILQIQIYQSFLITPKFFSLGPGFGSQAYQIFQVDSSPPLPALSACAHASRSIAHILKELLSHASRNEDTFVELKDVPTLLIGSFISAITLLILRTAQRHAEFYGNFDMKQNIHAPSLDSRGSDDDTLEVFMETLKRTQKRWARSARGLEIIRSAVSSSPKSPARAAFGGNEMQSPVSKSVSMGVPSQLLLFWSYSGSWTHHMDRTSTEHHEQYTPELQMHPDHLSQNLCEKYLEEIAHFWAATRESGLTPRHVTQLPHCSEPSSCTPSTTGPQDPNIPNIFVPYSSDEISLFNCFLAQPEGLFRTVEGGDDSQPQTSNGPYDQGNPIWFEGSSWNQPKLS